MVLGAGYWLYKYGQRSKQRSLMVTGFIFYLLPYGYGIFWIVVIVSGIIGTIWKSASGPDLPPLGTPTEIQLEYCPTVLDTITDTHLDTMNWSEADKRYIMRLDTPQFFHFSMQNPDKPRSSTAIFVEFNQKEDIRRIADLDFGDLKTRHKKIMVSMLVVREKGNHFQLVKWIEAREEDGYPCLTM